MIIIFNNELINTNLFYILSIKIHQITIIIVINIFTFFI